MGWFQNVLKTIRVLDGIKSDELESMSRRTLRKVDFSQNLLCDCLMIPQQQNAMGSQLI